MNFNFHSKAIEKIVFENEYAFHFKSFFNLAGSKKNDPLPIDVRIMKEVWSPDAEIRNLKEFKTLQVLSKVRIAFYTSLYSIGILLSFTCYIFNQL